ncbi:hypothetical protein [Zavarzinella formosa]|uniref:hypothetical protein n=1 Tax=Zavarzinella formosa TaxID=360055 RepID=UPI000306AAE0|nr:hypothetical protein [Zavarzinella formosa]
MPTSQLLKMMAVGYLLTVSVELPVLLAGLSRRHPFPHRLFAGFWLTACTYPVVWLVLPPLIENRIWYLVVAETFAPAGECLLFWIAFGKAEPRTRRNTLQDIVTITVANLISFGIGVLFNEQVGWKWLG